MTVVAICTPHGGRVSPEYYRHILMMQNAHPQHQFAHVDIDMILVGKARNELVKAARTSNAEVYWFVDDDILIPPEAGKLIDEAMQYGVVSGLYVNRRPPYLPQLYRIANEPEHQQAGTLLYWPIVEYPEGMFAVDATGNGCMAVRKDVFQKLEDKIEKDRLQMEVWQALLEAGLAQASLTDEQRWMMEQALAGLTRKKEPLSPWFEFLDMKGEDMYFCERVREAGLQVWADSTVKCLHLGWLPIGEQHFKYMQENQLIAPLPPSAAPPPEIIPVEERQNGHEIVDVALAGG